LRGGWGVVGIFFEFIFEFIGKFDAKKTAAVILGAGQKIL
jgi:hypothetical protein